MLLEPRTPNGEREGKKTHLFFKSERKYLQIFMGFLKSFPRNSPKYVFQDEQRKLSTVAQTGNSTTLGTREEINHECETGVGYTVTSYAVRP